MLYLAFLILIPSYLAFKRGHNGYGITLAMIACYVLSIIVGVVGHPLVGYGILFASLIAVILFIFLEPGSGNDPFVELEEKYAPGDLEIVEEQVVADDDWVVLRSYTESWQQPDIRADIAALDEQEIAYKFLGGLIASLMVHPADLERADDLLAKRPV